MIVKAPKGTLNNVIDDDESKKAYNKIKTQMENGKIKKDEKLLSTLENLHHIFFTSQDKELKIYKIDNGKIKEQLFEEKSNNNNLNQNLQNNNINNTNCIYSKDLENIKIGNNFNNNGNLSTEKNNQNIFSFDQINLENFIRQQNNKQYFNFDNNNNNPKEKMNNIKENSNTDKSNINVGISNIFKK